VQMKKSLLATGLGWPEGPAVLPDGGICFVETFRSQISVWRQGSGVQRYAYTAGGPNSCVVGAANELYVCQNGGTVGPWRAKEMVPPSIQRIDHEGGKAETLVTSIEGIALNGPNDLVFGPDGSLYFTDPGTYRPEDPDPSFIFVLRPDCTGSLLARLEPPTFPNGIAIEPSGDVVWAESYTGMVRRMRLPDGTIEDIARLPGEHPVADGMAVAADGRLFVTTVNGGGIDVLRPDGTYEQFIELAPQPTNCVFHDCALYVTSAGAIANTPDASFSGQLWLVEAGIEGVTTWRGTVASPQEHR
jgi:gluconolactonase